MPSTTSAPLGKRLRFRLTVFSLIGLVLVGFIVNDIVQRYITWWIALLAMAVGLAIGYGLGRSMKVRYDTEKAEIVAHMDIVGFIAIGIYVLLAIARNVLLGHFLSGNALTAVTLAVLAGALFGRYLGMDYSIRKLRLQL